MVIITSPTSSFALFALLLTWAAGGLIAQDHPPELGGVEWGRDLNEGLAAATETGKPLLILVQELPGRRKSVAFGREVLAHPLLAEAIAGEFVPVLVVNNREGNDAEMLARLSEEPWGYPIVRFFNGAGEELLPREAEVFGRGQIARRMAAALIAADRSVPKYLSSLIPPEGEVSEVALEMKCFMTGERKLGVIDGVIATEVGFVDRREVTRVWFDRARLSMDELLRRALEVKCADAIYTDSERDTAEARASAGRLRIGDLSGYQKARDVLQRRHIWRTPIADLDMPALQSTKVNALFEDDPAAALDWLSPRQRQAVAVAAQAQQGR